MHVSNFYRGSVIVRLFFIFAPMPNPILCFGQSEKMLSDTRYHDPNGFFIITPPAGWTVKEYPHDPRGKVKFTAPGVRGVSLLAIGMATEMSSIEDVVISTKESVWKVKE